jgi:hypothetical protein
VCPELPITATTKVLKQTLRPAAWMTDDPVFFRTTKSGPFTQLSDADRVELREILGDRHP